MLEEPAREDDIERPIAEGQCARVAEEPVSIDLRKSAWRDVVRDAGLRDVRIASAGVYPPYTVRDHERLVWKYGGFLRALDGTPLADILGFFYMVTARK